MRKLAQIGVIVVAATSLGACATNDPYGYSRNDDQRNRALGGAAIGAGAGAAIGAVVDGVSPVEGAIAGAVAGGIIGAVTVDGRERDLYRDQYGRRYWVDEYGRRVYVD